jgi:hypothetical protein
MNLLPILLLGLLGSVHCVGMCGGIVSAFSFSAGSDAPGIPVKIPVVASVPQAPGLLRVLAFNSGRIASYMLAGAIAGGVSASVTAWGHIATLQVVSYAMANLLLVALGLYLTDQWRALSVLTVLETAGRSVWRYVPPLMKHFLPVDNAGKALMLGAMWGWVPCGMVYSVLLTAMLSGSATSGALVMLAFGVGTLPALLSMGLLGARLRLLVRRPGLRLVSGIIVMLFGVLGLVRTFDGLSLGWLDALCVTPVAHHGAPADITHPFKELMNTPVAP